jgi:YfiH family protein
LNFSVNVGDEPARVQKNLDLAADALGVAPSRVYFLSQVHGANAVAVAGDESRESLLGQEGDSILGRGSGFACCVRTADCVPLLLGDRASGAAAAIHAGWRGTVAGVIESAVAELRSRGLGSDLVAAIGPHISLDAFEVSEDVARTLVAVSPDSDVTRTEAGQRPHVDLRKIVRAKLGALGLDGAAIDDVPGCTVLEPERFFSYRRDGKHSGRLLSGIVPRAE